MKKTGIRVSAAVLALVMLLSLVGCSAGTKTAEATKVGTGAKTISFTVYHGDGSKKEFSLSTDAALLSEALLEEKLIDGSESEYGLFVTTVDGETADDAQQEWWCLTKSGQMHMFGVDATEIADGENYQFTLAKGYDEVIEYPEYAD